jgi:hypothetical protein
LKLALLIGTVGALLGIGWGVWLASSMVELYREFYSFPVLKFDIDPLVVGTGLVVSLLFASLGALGAMRSIIKLTPADGLRPEAPAIYRKTLFERHAGFLWRRLSFAPRTAQAARGRDHRRRGHVGVDHAARTLFAGLDRHPDGHAVAAGRTAGHQGHVSQRTRARRAV